MAVIMLSMHLLLVLAITAMVTNAFIVYIPKGHNKAGAIIFNSSIDSGRIYSLNTQLTPSYAKHFVDVTSQNGIVFLKRPLLCSADALSKVVPWPLTIHIESQSFRIGGSQTKLILIPLNIYFAHDSCPRMIIPSSTSFDNNKDHHHHSSSTYGLLIHNNEKVCVKRSQFLIHLPQFIPYSIVAKCNIEFDTGSVSESVLKYSVERHSSDLVSLSDGCITASQFNASVALRIDCTEMNSDTNSDMNNETIGTIVKGNTDEAIELTFHFGDEDIDEFIRKKRVNINTRNRREMRNSPPLFEKSLYIVSVSEEKEKGFIVATMRANDPEHTDILYSMSAVLDARSQSMFVIDAVSGAVTTTARLDREFMDVHYLRITAVDSGIPPLTGTTTLQINVNDENDHSPTFEQASYETNLRESAPIGTTVITVRATDQDSGPNSDIEYSILNPTGPNEAFRIDSHSGMITTRAPLDRETIDFYSLTVQANDLGPVQNRKHSETIVSLRIVDDNDNYPQFSERSYSVQVPEDINWLNHPVIMKVNAYDADEGLNAAIRYSIIGGNTHGIFQMDSLNGEISVISGLDYESFRSYRLVLRAQDAGSPPRSNTTQLLINVIDKNDNEPKFYSSLFQETVVENTPVGSSIIRVQAYDPDDGQNAAITYSIRNSNKPDMPLGIDNETGWIIVTRELDWEEGNLYEFVVVAHDGGSPMLSSTANVIIRVQDINDNSPLFDPKIYESTVSEIDSPGSPVVSVTATDRDENSRLIFQITSGNTRGRFSITSQNGQGLITIAQPLDYKAEKKFIMTVSATDPGGRSDVATVYINVTDANTHRPIIERTPYAVGILEDSPIGTTILIIEASDADVGENARITFQMDDVPEFRIDPNSGALITAKALDREASAGYTIVVTAIDNGTPPLADTTNVEIEISDVNDNGPEFKQNSYTTAISEDALVGSSVLQIEAIDRDLGLNGQVRYTFSGGNDGSGTFVIDPTSGIIRTNKILDRETTAKFELIAFAYDRGTPAMSGSVPVTVFIEDCNDNPPRFASDRIQFYVPENSPIGWIVGEVNAIDPDEGPNAKIEYSIVGGPDMKAFSLRSRSGDSGAELITHTEMDFESDKKKYNIIIRASSLPLRNDVDVEVHVTDVNDHAPILRDFSIIFNNYKSHFPLNRPIGRIPAFDADVADKLKYKFVSGNNANLLILNETSGEIRLSPSLNTNVPMRALFEVNVFDGINEATATCNLIVNLVTEAMLFNSVTIRLNRITQHIFLSEIFDRFLEGLAAIIPCPKENIVIFNVQDDTETDSRILNVSFSARLSDARDTESFYSPQFLHERVYLSRPILTKMANLEVLPFDDNLCVREPCLNFEQCLSVLKFGNASDFISSDTILFRAISPVNTFACRCPQGFQGMHHKYECDTEINLCFSGPCQNSGTCIPKEGGYQCMCVDGHTGKNCEVNFYADLCRSGLCKGDSRCINSRSMKIKPTSGIGGFHCTNCSLADWSSPLCELRARTFTKGSYLTFSSLRQRYRLNIRLSFSTRENNALLFYNGRYNEKHDFIALEIIDSRIVLSLSLGANVTQVSASLYGVSINNGKWHNVEVDYFNRTATLKLDNCDESLLRAVQRKQLDEKYACANRTTLHLEPRCADKMQTCYRFLDLTGPLQIGGLPPLPTRFQILNNHFSGCVTDLYIDHQLIDLNSYVANNGTLPGCDQKRNFCQSYPCRNGGTCEDGWSSFVCYCPDGYGGQECNESNEVVKQFKGDGFLSFTPRLRPLSLPWIVRFSFKTYHPNGLLMKLQLGQNSIVLIELINGMLKYSHNSQSATIPDARFNDGKWHFLEANWMTNGIWLNMDYGQYEENNELMGDIRGLYIAKVTIGGIESNDEDAGDFISPNFIGCIQGVDIGNSKDSWLRPSLERNVYEGCTSVDPCLALPCPPHSKCINKGMSNYECKCNTGYVGTSCIPICELNPCEPQSVCIPWNNTRGYICQCDKMHSGIYCQNKLPETCPSNWWGYPICGPCNCDTTKGYDGNCNKTNGECNCEANYFQPLNSDICFDCDCYAIGSYSNKCDGITGQCRCRPGVIGRRCDSCPSPFSEVTLRGCEVIYDGCPRSFSEGIWWERTLFGSDAVQSCSAGSVGKAIRHCNEANGWSRPDLFDCTSDAFVDLSDQLTLLEKEKFPLTTYLSIKIANDLRLALNTTYPLYGSDISITFRLIYHLINNELKQTGLNLTHKQDRHFMRNIIESTSLILEPRYLFHWERIGETVRYGGTEQFLKLYDSYTEVLIENQQDTFTEPFEISTKYMIFGMDTVSSNELWDMPKSLQSYMNRTSFIHSSIPSIYIDFSQPQDAGPGVSIPKYNNYPIRKQNIDEITRAVIPLKSLGVKTIEEIAASPFTTAHHKPHQQKAQIGYAIFPSLGQLMPGAYDSSVRQRFGMPIKANTPLFMLTLKPVNISKSLKIPAPKFHFRLRTLMRDGRSNPQCAYWTFASSGRQKTGIAHSRGRWSTRGCELKGFHPPQKYRLSYDYINCSCDRTVGVVVLMDVANNEFLVQESLTQVLTSYSGVVTSLVLLAVTFFILSVIRGLETNSNSIHRNLVFCLFFAEFLFLLALRVRSILVLKEFPCKMMAIFIQYFFMCIFSWMLVEGVHLYRMLTEIRDINHGPMRFYYFVGYAVPAIIVGLSVGVRADQYGNYLFCWLSIYESVIWSMVGPICIAAVLNLIVFGMALQASVQIKDTVSDYGNLRTLLWLSIILLPLLGGTWILAMLSVNDSLEELHYGFSVMSVISAIYIFIGYCVINRRVRHNIRVTWWRLKGKKVAYVDESLSGTRTSVASRTVPTYHNSSFDILHRNICASSTTSRSTVTKTSSSPYRSDPSNPGASGMTGMTRKSHGRRHKRRNNLAESESDSDVSFDRSFDLASSHSSDEDDDNRSAPRQNQINSAIQQNQNVLFTADATVFSHSLRPSNSEQTYIGGNERNTQSKWPQVNSSAVSSSQGSPLTEHGQFLSSRPYSRSNILAMTAGFSGSRTASREMVASSPKHFVKEINTFSQFSPPFIDHSEGHTPLNEGMSRFGSTDIAHHYELSDNIYGYNINLENNDVPKSGDSIVVEDVGVNNQCESHVQMIEEEKTDFAESQTNEQRSSIISKAAAVIPPLIAPDLTSESE